MQGLLGGRAVYKDAFRKLVSYFKNTLNHIRVKKQKTNESFDI